ncbi:MAG: type II toxin-antitoxin system prevent-host-death family antitoxin, partial [Aphanizomenon sp.]
QRGAKMFLYKLKETQSPIVLTVNGKAAAVVQDAESYQKLIDRLELLESVAKIRQSINEFEQGEGMPLNQAFAEFKET